VPPRYQPPQRTHRGSVAGIEEPVTAAGLKPAELQAIIDRQQARLAAQPAPKDRGTGSRATERATQPTGPGKQGARAEHQRELGHGVAAPAVPPAK
jgi:hypothetical protein